MKMVILLTLEDGKGTIREHCVNLERRFFFRTAEKLKNKAGTAWHTGIWLGKDIEADESLVQGEGTVLKVRTVKGVIPSKQWNTELHKSLNSTPWDPKR